MRRGLDIDSLECPRRCGQGQLTFLACIQPSVTRQLLEHLGLPAGLVAPAPARGPATDDQFDLGA
ncbi:MAG: ATP-dependent helicase HrpA [Sandaracinaceae bacterium]|nr:MAG: ATP-dependent helicase HrpA [Sandaracinaceae bacterium]